MRSLQELGAKHHSTGLHVRTGLSFCLSELTLLWTTFHNVLLRLRTLQAYVNGALTLTGMTHHARQYAYHETGCVYAGRLFLVV